MSKTILQEKIEQIMALSLEAFVILEQATYEIIFQNDLTKKYFSFDNQEEIGEFVKKMEQQLTTKNMAEIKNTALRYKENTVVYCDLLAGFLDEENSILWIKIRPIASELNQKRTLDQNDSEMMFIQAVPRLFSDILFSVNPVTHTLTHAGDLYLQFGLPRVLENYPYSIVEQGIVHPEDQEEFLAYSNDVLLGIADNFNFRIKLIDNTYEWYATETTAVRDHTGKLVEILGKLTNIQKQKQLEEVANYDALTQTLHGNSFREMVEKSLNNTTGALLFLDIDDFNNVNVTYGHDFGNVFLTELGTRLNNSVRSCDYVGRITGDQFVIFLKNISDETFLERKVKQLLKLTENAIGNEKCSHHFTFSLGVAHYPKTQDNYEELLSSAQKAMQCAKDDGGNQANLCQNNEIYQVITLEDEAKLIHNALGMLDNNASAFVVFNKSTQEVVSENKKARDLFFSENHEFNIVEVFGSAEKAQEIIVKLQNELNKAQLITIYDMTLYRNNMIPILCDLEFSYISDDKSHIYLKISEKNDKKLQLMKTLIEKIQSPVVVIYKDEHFTISYANSKFYNEFGSDENTFYTNYGNHFPALLLPEKQEEFVTLFKKATETSSKGELSIPLCFATGEVRWLEYDCDKLKSMDSAKKIYCQLNNKSEIS